MEIVQIFSPNVLLKDTNKYLVENIVKFRINLIDVVKCVSHGFHRSFIPLHLWNQKFIEFFPKDQKKSLKYHRLGNYYKMVKIEYN